MAYKKNIIFDFDGVISDYSSGWQGANVINDKPVEGIKEVIEELRKKCKIVVVSTRCYQEGGIKAIVNWLLKYDIIVDDVTAEKPPAVVSVDDRCICFKGDTKGLISQIEGFKNWLSDE